MSAFVVRYLDPNHRYLQRFISCASSLKEACDSMLSFVCTCPDLDFSLGFLVYSFVDGVFDSSSHYSYDSVEDRVWED